LVAIEGWAVYSGCEGDASTFRGFFIREEDAEAFSIANDPDEEEEFPLCVDPAAVVALLTDDGIYTANDYEIETHQQLRDRLIEHRRKT
jgi:hypothetical protein